MATAPPHPSTRPFSDLVLDFLAYLELERGLSRNTLEAYRTDLQQFGVWVDENGHSALEVAHTQLTEFIGQLGTGERGKGKAVAPATVQRKVACLRSFYRHLRREEILDRDPTAELKGPPKGRTLPPVLSRDEGALRRAPPADPRAPPRGGTLPQVLSRDEVALLLAQPQGADPAALRDRALLELM